MKIIKDKEAAKPGLKSRFSVMVPQVGSEDSEDNSNYNNNNHHQDEIAGGNNDKKQEIMGIPDVSSEDHVVINENND